MTNLINRFKENPKSLVLIDLIGAFISTISLGFVLVHLEAYFGIPRQALYLLALLASFLILFDGYIYYQVKHESIGKQLKILGFLNTSYVIFSLAFVSFFHFSSVLTLGWIYLLLEVLIVLFLATLEIQVASALRKER